jgi:type III secretory pathway lipoprotein EscJ
MLWYSSKNGAASVLFVGVALFLSGCKETLSNSLTDHEATKLTHELNKRQIPAEKRASNNGMFSVLVPAPHVNDAFSTLDKLQRFTKNDKQQQVSAPGIMSSSLETQLYVSRQLANEIENTLMLIPGTLAVRVVVAPVPDSGVSQATATRQNFQPSASVMIVTDASETVASSDTIAKYVAAGLNTIPDRVQVMIVSSSSQESAMPTPHGAPPQPMLITELNGPPPSALPLSLSKLFSPIVGLHTSSGHQRYLILATGLLLLAAAYRYTSRAMLVRRLQQL